MSSHLNRVTLIGNLGSDPEVKTLANGSRMATFRLATTEKYLDKGSNEWREVIQWHSIVVWDESCIKRIEREFKKGTLAFIEGQLLTRSYSGSDGRQQYVTEVVLKMYRGQCMTLSNRKEPFSSGSSSGTSTSSIVDSIDLTF